MSVFQIMGGSGKSPLCNNLAGLLAGSPSSVGSTEQKKTPLSASAYAKKIYDDVSEFISPVRI